MKHIAPMYYTSFRCIAGRCQHSCCIGWEIDIDNDTAARYLAVEGDFGARLKDGIAQTEDGCSFILTNDERCPFLNQNGLCDIISTLGEDALCQICADHPRFRGYFSDRVEIGLGLCCEEAARIVLTAESDELIVLDDDGNDEPLYDEERDVLDTRDTAFAVARDHSRSIREREQALLGLADRAPLSANELFDRLSPLERLDADWSDVLVRLHTTLDVEPPAELQTAFERLLVYFLFRHLPDALDDDRLSERVAFAAHSVKALRLLCAADGYTLESLLDLTRRYCSEIEYSDENMDALLDSF